MYEFTEQDELLQVCINITNNVTVEANISITVRTDAEEGTADIRDFEVFEKEIIVSSGKTCFEIKVFPDAILEDEETFPVSIESSDSALNVVVSQAEVTILDSTSEFFIVPKEFFLAMYIPTLHINTINHRYMTRNRIGNHPRTPIDTIQKFACNPCFARNWCECIVAIEGEQETFA